MINYTKISLSLSISPFMEMSKVQTTSMDMEDPEAVLYPSYYVQSPSTTTTISHANSADIIPNDNNSNRCRRGSQDEASFLAAALSRYSSRGSNHSASFLHDKSSAKVAAAFDDLQSHDDSATRNGEKRRLVIVDGCVKEEDEGGMYSGGWWRFFSFSHSSSTAWVLLQVSWRLVVSLWVALLVFYLVTKPSTPNISIKIERVPEFELAEGVDTTGVSTKVLTCNLTVRLVIDNRSKLFGLHARPPVLHLLFGRLPLATSPSRGREELYAESGGPTELDLHVGTKNKPMYGAGRLMQDMVDSGEGLPLVVRTALISSYHVVGCLISPKFIHHWQCSLALLGGPYDRTRRTHPFNSSCSVS
ncbi:hypothetical protein SAY86_029898 [Trapa natans]|uniref:Late embryogenesis abundant protein LEA-2 subgroup domain-containing protein n=1 Tax=Trapa natans TaxID=22666 RepID=A0AAN7MF71_TRANT|nr:hypothetical protein SAY86_029898 [Trapa natans]